MIKVENIDVWGFEHAIHGMRNPLGSWPHSDSRPGCEVALYQTFCDRCGFNSAWCGSTPRYIIGPNDLKLMRKLYQAGSEHRKFMRQVFVSMDVVCNHIWWAEFDTYKVGVTRDSCSKMHTIHVKGFEADDFSHEGLDAVGEWALAHFYQTVDILEHLRKLFNETGEKKYWRAMLELLPMGYNLRATITMNYENVVNMIRQREFHKLDEWRKFVGILKGLPYIAEITGEDNGES